MFLIDGNNLAGRTTKNFSDEDRRELLTLLAQFARMQRTRVSVVFDGTPDRHYPDGSAFQGVKIHYAHCGSTADTRIRQLVERSRTPREYVVVTDDRELQVGVRVRQARVMTSAEFRARLEQLITRNEHLPGESKPATRREEINDWLRYFGVSPHDHELNDDELFADEMMSVTTRPPPAKKKRK